MFDHGRENIKIVVAEKETLLLLGRSCSNGISFQLMEYEENENGLPLFTRHGVSSAVKD